MNKVWKKWISGISALALFASGSSALAEQIITGTNYWKHTFENLAAYTAPEEMLVTVDDDADEDGAVDIAAAQAALEAGGVFAGGKGGLYGKAEDDSAFAVEQDGDFSGKLVMRNTIENTDSMRKKAGLNPVGKGNFAHLRFEMAIADYNFERSVQLSTRYSTKATPTTLGNPVVGVDTAGAVKVLGTDTSYTMPLDKWVRFDLVFGDTENISTGSCVDVYADGNLIIKEKRFDAAGSKGMQQLGTVDDLVFTYNLGGQSGTYIDNFTAQRLPAPPEFSEVVLSHTDPEFNGRIDNEAKSINLVSTTTVAEFLDGLNRTDVQVVTENGVPQDGAVVNGAVIVGSGDERVYYRLETYQQSFYVQADFEDVSVTDADSLEDAASLTLSGAGTLSVQAGPGARDAANNALQLEADGANAITWAGDAIGNDTVSIEESVMLAGDLSAALTMTAGGQDYTLASWNADHTVQALGQTAGSWRDYAWYKAVAVLNKETNDINVYINGELAATQPLPAGGVERVALETAGTGIVGLDDVKLHTGEYVPGTDDVVLTANNTNYIVSEEDNVIYIPADTTVDTLLANITVSDNAAFQGAYADAAMTEETAAQTVAGGDYVVFASKIRSVYEAYEIRVTDGAQGILGVTIERMRYDNDAKTIFAPAYTPVAAFVDAVRLASGHIGTVVDAQGQPLADTDGIGMGTLDGNRFTVTYDNGVNQYSNTYDILTTYAYAGFEDVYGEEIKPNELYGGFKYENQKNSGGEVTLKGVDDPAGSGAIVGQLTAKPQTAQGDAQQVLQYSSKDLLETTKPFAISWDIYNDSTTNGYNRIILTKTDSGGNSGYYTLFEMQNGNIKMCSGSVVATCQPDTWNRMILLFSPGGNGNCILYVNGKSVYSGGTLFKAAASIQEFYFTSGVSTSGRVLYYDNLAVYPISSAKDFDTTGMDSTVTSSYDILEKQTISGYGPATAKQVMELFDYKDGATAKMYAADGKTPVADDAQAEAGMKMVVTSGNGLYTTMYTLAEPVRYTAPEILIGGRSVKYLISGEATATAGVYSAYPLPLTLRLTYTAADGSTNTVESKRPADHRGQFDFVTESVGMVQNVEGEKLTLTWTDEAGNAYAEPQEIVWTGQLDLSSEIAMVKNNAISIVTITQDDGDVGTLNKLNSWFAQYGLRGTSVLPSQDVKTASGANTYRKIFESGYIDVTSHSETEANLGANPPTEEQRLRELKGSRDTLREVLGQEVLTFAPSNNVLDPQSQEVVREYYWAVRQGGEGYNSLDPAEGNGVGQWYNLRNMFNQKPKRQNGEACTLDETLDEVIKEPCWMIEMHHVINEKGQGTLPITDTEANSHFRKMGEMQDAGLIWVASFDEATKYIRERQHTAIEDVALDGSRVINLYTDGYLPADVFDDPLTIKSQVPDDWANTDQFVKVTQGGKVQSPEITVVDGRLGILYDAYPNGGPITIELVDEPPAVTLSEVKVTSEGELEQVAGAMEPVVFTASTVPAENVDTTGIQWFVNDVQQKEVPDGTLVFSFRAERAGEYTIYAKDAKSGFASKPLTVTLTEPGVLFEDDFDGYGDADILSDNWYTSAPINLVENPKEPGDTVAAVGPNPTNTYPGMHQTVATFEGMPAAFTGSVLMVGGKQRFYLEARSSDQKVKKSVLEFMENGDVVFKGPEDVKIAKNPLGTWVALCIHCHTGTGRGIDLCPDCAERACVVGYKRPEAGCGGLRDAGGSKRFWHGGTGFLEYGAQP